MGMMLCEAIETLLYNRSYGNVDIAKSVAINTMRKFQKIQEIVSDWKSDGGVAEPYWLRLISEVIEDGNE